MDRRIRVEVYRQNFRLYIPKFYKNMMNDFTGRLISYSKMYNRKKKKYISIEDKRWWVERRVGMETLYIFQIEILRDVLLFFRVQGIDILDKELFSLINKDISYTKATVSLRPQYVLRDYQIKYRGTVCENDVRKALIELQTGSGKFLTNDTPIRIPDGWKAIGDIKVGDEVISVDGTKTKVLGVYPHKNKEIFRITFADGRSTKCGAEHLWNVYHPDFDAVQRNGNRKPTDGFGKAFRTLDTATIKKRLSSGTSWSRRHYIDLADSEQNEDKKYFIDPYILGCILGDGGISCNSISLTISSPSVIERMITKLRPGYKIAKQTSRKDYEYYLVKDRDSETYKSKTNLLKQKNEYISALRVLGLMGKTALDKFIPKRYLNGSTEQRLELLRGLMDTDGCVGKGGNLSYSTSSLQLAKDIQYLIRSLGGLAKIRGKIPFYTYKGERKQGSVNYIINIRMKSPLSIVTRPEKRAERLEETNQYSDTLKLRIVSIESVGYEDATCIAVDHPSKLYVVENHIVTHNTIIGLSIVAEKGHRSGILLPGYVQKWISDILETLDIDSSRVYLIQGSKSIEKLIHEYRMFNNLDYDLFIIANATFSNFVRDSEAGKISIKPEEFTKMLNIGTLLVDEIHERFFGVYQFCLYANPETIVGMTATFTSSSEYVKKFQDMMFPKHTRLNFVPINKYINTLAVQYSLSNPESAKYKNGEMYSHDVYENSTIIKYKNRLMNYIEMIEHYMDTEYLDDTYKKGSKLVIFVASIRFATMLTEYLKHRYRNLDIERYVGEDDYENVINPDVRVSTMQSAGTAVDIPGLTVVLNTVLARSPIRNKQSHGRLREIKDTEVRYIYFYCTDIRKHKEFNNVRTEQLRPYSKTYREVCYDKKI